MREGIKMLGLFAAGSAVCVLWALAGSKSDSSHIAKSAATSSPAVTREQLIGRWSTTQPVRAIGGPLTSYVAVVFRADGSYTQIVRLHRRNGEVIGAPWESAGNWRLDGEDLVLSAKDEQTQSTRELKTILLLDGQELDLLAEKTEEGLPDSTLRREASP